MMKKSLQVNFNIIQGFLKITIPNLAVISKEKDITPTEQTDSIGFSPELESFLMESEECPEAVFDMETDLNELFDIFSDDDEEFPDEDDLSEGK